MKTPELLTDDMDIRDTKLSMYVGGNGDYYVELKETKNGEIIKLDTRIATSGGNATPEVLHAIAYLFKALRGEIYRKDHESKTKEEIQQKIFVNLYEDKDGRFISDEDYSSYDEAYNNKVDILKQQEALYGSTIKSKRNRIKN